jgi:hypothetical protein
MTLAFKKNIMFFIFFFTLSNIFSQNNTPPIQSPTTELEYNYVTKGYKNDFANGHDIKEGYILKEIQVNRAGERKVQLNGLYRLGELTPCAIMIVYTKTDQASEYFCIPTYNASAELWNKFYDSLDDEYGSQENKYKIILFTLAQAQMKLLVR